MRLSADVQRQYDELCTVLDYAEGTRLQRERTKRAILKTVRRTGALDVTQLGPSLRWNLCAARLRLGRFDNWDGWEYRSNWSITFMGYNGFEKMQVPKWMGQPTKRLIVLGEQGIGDEILFASVLPELIVRLGHDAIEFQTFPRLREIFARSFGVRCSDRKVLSKVVGGDYCVALGDLLRFYRRDKSHFPRRPFLKPNPAHLAKWRARLADLGSPNKPRIGLAWKARHGTLDPRDLMMQDAFYVNLQYGQPVPDGVLDLGADPLIDMDDHIALVAALDSVVSVTQTVVHEAGAVGTPCQAIIPPPGTGEVHNFLWYYGLGGYSMIYGSVNVYPSIIDFHDKVNRPGEVVHSRSR